MEEKKLNDLDDPYYVPGEAQMVTTDMRSAFEKVLIRCMERSYDRNEMGKFTNVAVALLDGKRFKTEDLQSIQFRLDELANDVYGPEVDRNFVFKLRLNRSRLNLWLAKKKEMKPRRKRNESPLVLGMPENILQAIKDMVDFETIVIHQDKVAHGLSSIKSNIHKHIEFSAKVWISSDLSYLAIYRQPKDLASAVYGREFMIIKPEL